MGDALHHRTHVVPGHAGSAARWTGCPCCTGHPVRGAPPSSSGPPGTPLSGSHGGLHRLDECPRGHVEGNHIWNTVSPRHRHSEVWTLAAASWSMLSLWGIKASPGGPHTRCIAAVIQMGISGVGDHRRRGTPCQRGAGCTRVPDDLRGAVTQEAVIVTLTTAVSEGTLYMILVMTARRAGHGHRPGSATASPAPG